MVSAVTTEGVWVRPVGCTGPVALSVMGPEGLDDRVAVLSRVLANMLSNSPLLILLTLRVFSLFSSQLLSLLLVIMMESSRPLDDRSSSEEVLDVLSSLKSSRSSSLLLP